MIALFDPAAPSLESMFKFRPGDTIRFHPLGKEAAEAERNPSRFPALPNIQGLLEIVAGGEMIWGMGNRER